MKINEVDRVNRGFTDVMYGVVLGYGFRSFDLATSPRDYLLFFFTFLIFVIDWIYSHKYWNQKYSKQLVTLEIITIFVFSRLLASATTGDTVYYLWLAILFILYFVWDLGIRITNSTKLYNVNSALWGDVLVFIAYSTIWILFSKNIINTQSLPVNLALILVYICYLFTWLIRTNSKTKKLV